MSRRTAASRVDTAMRIRFVLTWKRVAGLVGLGIAGALLVGWTGVVSIAASSGHWGVTSWFLHWTMRNAVSSQSMGIEMPEDLDLSDPALVLRSAGHYATGCAACHGAPGVPQSPVVEAMVPTPPRLEENVGAWSDAELFWIVKNGLKYTGMPAWPAQERDDEVWAQVVFLRALPDMTPAEYADLALGGGLTDNDLEAGGETLPALDGIFETALADCARCHGRDGLGRGEGATEGAFPVIAGQPATYLGATLQAFASGERGSGFMQPPASRYDADVLWALALHYAGQPGPQVAGPEIDRVGEAAPGDGTDVALPPESRQDEAGILDGDGVLAYGQVSTGATAGPPRSPEVMRELGRRIAVEGIGGRKIPACQSCHGQAGQARNPFYPDLAGQPEWYLVEQLRLWSDGARGGTAYAHLMDEVVRNMTDEQIEAVGAWYAELAQTAR